MTGETLWLALTAQGHHVSIADCKRIADIGPDVWVSEYRGVYLSDQAMNEYRAAAYGVGAWLIRDWQVQQVAVDLLPRLLAGMRNNGEL